MSYTVKDVMQKYGVSQASVLHWLASGQLKFISVSRDPGKKRQRYRILDSHIAEFEAARTGTPPQPRKRRRKFQEPEIKDYIG